MDVVKGNAISMYFASSHYVTSLQNSPTKLPNRFRLLIVKQHFLITVIFPEYSNKSHGGRVGVMVSCLDFHLHLIHSE